MLQYLYCGFVRSCFPAYQCSIGELDFRMVSYVRRTRTDKNIPQIKHIVSKHCTYETWKALWGKFSQQNSNRILKCELDKYPHILFTEGIIFIIFKAWILPWNMGKNLIGFQDCGRYFLTYYLYATNDKIPYLLFLVYKEMNNSHIQLCQRTLDRTKLWAWILSIWENREQINNFLGIFLYIVRNR